MMESEALRVFLMDLEHVYDHAHARFLQENGRHVNGGSVGWISAMPMERFQRKTHKRFDVTVFLGRTDAPEVRCDLNTQTNQLH